MFERNLAAILAAQARTACARFKAQLAAWQQQASRAEKPAMGAEESTQAQAQAQARAQAQAQPRAQAQTQAQLEAARRKQADAEAAAKAAARAALKAREEAEKLAHEARLDDLVQGAAVRPQLGSVLQSVYPGRLEWSESGCGNEGLRSCGVLYSSTFCHVLVLPSAQVCAKRKGISLPLLGGSLPLQAHVHATRLYAFLLQEMPQCPFVFMRRPLGLVRVGRVGSAPTFCHSAKCCVCTACCAAAWQGAEADEEEEVYEAYRPARLREGVPHPGIPYLLQLSPFFA